MRWFNRSGYVFVAMFTEYSRDSKSVPTDTKIPADFSEPYSNPLPAVTETTSLENARTDGHAPQPN
jgi:hypothetical protein